MASQERSNRKTSLTATLTTLAIGASLALAAWGTSGAFAGTGKTEALTSTSREAASVYSCPQTSTPASNDAVDPPRGRRF